MEWDTHRLEGEADAFPRVWLLDHEPTLTSFGVAACEPTADLPLDYDTLPALREAARLANPRVLSLELFAVLRVEATCRREKILAREPPTTSPERDPLEPTVTDLLFDLCSERSERRVGAVDELYGMDPVQLQDGLVRCLDEEAGGVRWLAAQCLAALQVDLALPDLRRMAESDDVETRYLSRCALSHLATPDDVDLIVSSFAASDGLRLAALRGLRRLLDTAPDRIAPKSIGPLTTLANDDRDAVRIAAAQLLGEIATRFPSPALRQALPVLRRRAWKAPWSARGVAGEEAARRACREAATRIQSATKNRKSLPLPVESSSEDGQNLPRASDAGAPGP